MIVRNRSERVLYLFIIPALAVYLFFYIYPMFQGLWYSTTDWNGFAPKKNFIGFKNYVDIFKDRHILTAIQNTFVYTVIVTFFSNLIGLVLALMLEERSRITRTFRTLFFIPAVLSPVVVSFVWKYMYSPHSGVTNSLLRLVGLDVLAQDWLGNPHLALPSVMLVPLWQWGGNVMIVFLAGLMIIPTEYYESARVDGVNFMQRFRYVTWPLLRPAVVFNLVISTIGSFKTFDFIFIMTNGGPGYLTEVLTLTVYNYTLYTAKFGYGTAVGALLTLFVVVFCIVELRVLSRNSESYI